MGLDKGDNVFQIYVSEELKQALTQDHWIFIRLYQPYYDNPLCIENVLSKCIQFVDVNPDYSSHSAIGFSLDDGFYGLTSSNSGHNLYLESCTNSGDNEYMKKCNIYKSVEITYARASLWRVGLFFIKMTLLYTILKNIATQILSIF